MNMKNRIDINKISLVCLSMIAIILPFREFLSEYLFSGFKIVPDLLVLTYFIAFLFYKKFKIKFDTIDLLYALFILYGLFTTLMNQEGILRFILQSRSICLYYMIYFIIKNINLKHELYYSFARVLKVVVYVVVFMAVIEVITNKEFLFPGDWINQIIYYDNFIRAYSIINNPNIFAAFLIFSFIFYYQISDNYWCSKNILFTVTVFLGILISISRSAIIMLVLFLILRLASNLYECKKKNGQREFNRWTITILVASVMCWGAVHLSNQTYMTLMSIESSQYGAIDRFGYMFNEQIIQESNTDGRIYNIKKGIEIFLDHPFIGTGFGTYGSAGSMMIESSLVSEYGISEDLYSDNEFIVILVETGLVGTSIFIAFILAILWKYRNDWFKLVFCIVFAGFGMFYNILEVQPLSFLFWLCLGIPDIKRYKSAAVQTNI